VVVVAEYGGAYLCGVFDGPGKAVCPGLAAGYGAGELVFKEVTVVILVACTLVGVGGYSSVGCAV
jgi:hypothetical protein